MSSKVKKPSTPLKSTKISTGGSSSAKMKQSSLMSFFKPAATPVASNKELAPSGPTSSSPLKGKSNTNSFNNSDKENNTSIMEEEEDEADTTALSTRLTDTPLTSETEATPIKSKSYPTSSPVAKKEVKKPLNSSTKDNLASSPVVKRRATKSVSYAESDEDEDEDTIMTKKKRRKIVESEDDDDGDDEDDFKPEGSDDEDDMSDFVVEDDKDEDSAKEEEDDDEEDYDDIKISKKSKSPPAKKSTSSTSTPTSSNVLGNKFKSNSSYQATGSSTTTKKAVSKPTSSPPPKKNFAKENEERYQWLVNVRDGEKRPIDDPNYDERTLYIPQSAWSKFTAFEKQYWEIKSQMWNTVVFFKKGKFYELYENDANIANSEFDLKIAGGGRANMKLAGIPEMSFEYWAKEFISHGYKVAKVDQKETLLAKEMRGGTTKEEKIIKRELSSILTGGTLTDLDMIGDDMSVYCISIKQEVLDDGSNKFGVALVDTSTSELNLLEFNDDSECTKLDTLITQIKPKEIICEKLNLCPIAIKMLKFNGQKQQIWNSLNPITEFWDYDSTIEKLVESKYYPGEDLDDFSNYPSMLITYKDNNKLAFNAFGGLLYYLKLLKLDQNIMTLGNFNEYEISKSRNTTMLLDGITLNNLEILSNSFDGGDKGTLFKLINKSITSFGKRQLKNWILHPLIKVSDINARFDSIDYLMNNYEVRSILENGLIGLPDLERLLSRIHSKNLKFKDFLKVIESFESINKLIKKISNYEFEGSIKSYIAQFPQNLNELTKEWEDAFNREEAKQDIIVPNSGFDEEFDDSQMKLNDLESQLNQRLREYKKIYKSQEICYRDSGKEIYLIEVPNKIVKNIPNDWQTMGSTAKVKRYWSPEGKLLARELMEQRELHKQVCESLKERMYNKFNVHYNEWMKIIKTISLIDCLLALTKSSETMGFPSCRPQFIEYKQQGEIEFKELRNPCFLGTKEFIPNDVNLGGKEAKFGLLTGANAAGKSTLMRTTSLAVILSQIGCYVPCQSARLTPIDKIMTRLGAQDNILQGKSTFFVELSETKKILSNATPFSLVILDELGRGGSSSDGYAIAESVLYHLSTHIQSLGFFATHYGSLGSSFNNHPQIKPLRMGIIVDKDSRNITFLYKLEEGTAPGSFGMNVASMCGISEDIVKNAEISAKTYEQTSKIKEGSSKSTDAIVKLGLQSDFSWFVNKYEQLGEDIFKYDEDIKQNALVNVFKLIEKL
ncbi:mismatch repair ATPase MSH6 [Scheffersomyces coipomensis]|uniref:mismatch repair ATPase MSH6 n=1 Tax=Scheffersomyces coipomensis TaxID=1788519 RepID=UPI00315C4D6A